MPKIFIGTITLCLLSLFNDPRRRWSRLNHNHSNPTNSGKVASNLEDRIATEFHVPRVFDLINGGNHQCLVNNKRGIK